MLFVPVSLAIDACACTSQNHELLVIPQSLLSNENVSQHFVAILFRFLSARLPDLGNNNKENTSVMLRLYKMSSVSYTHLTLPTIYSV